MKLTKKQARKKRGLKTRARQKVTSSLRLVVHRTPKHIYAQVIKTGDQIQRASDSVLLAASTLDKNISSEVTATGNVDAAKLVGKEIAEKAKKAGITKVAADRSGFKYHGRIEALFSAARENGLEI